jgi:heavy metal translocating P-type ATPase
MTTTSYSPTANQETLLTEFFEMGQQECVSPFLQPDSRKWSVNLTLKAALLAALLLILSFAGSFHPQTAPLSKILLICVYFLAGIPSLIEAIEDLSDGEINIDILMTLAAFSSIFIGSGLEGGLLLVLFSFSGAMEDAVTNKAKGALSSLHKLSPTKASVIEPDGTLIEKAVRSIPVGTKILVKSGQVIPLDGDIIDGTSSVNLVHLTGENFPVTKTVGDNVPAGGKNLEGALTVVVTKTSADSTLSRIIQLVTQAQEARPLLQRWFDKASKGYAITIIGLSAAFALVLPWFLSIPFLGVEGSLYRAIAFLIAASPCALIIAIPIAYLSAVSACAKRGILLKGGITLDALARCRAIAFDKTGTLTTGDLTCLSLEALNPEDNHPKVLDQALAVAYAMERNAVHPIAAAIMNYGEQNKTNAASISNFTSIPGYGLKAMAALPDGNQEVYIGRSSYIADQLQLSLQAALVKRTKEIEDQGELLAVLIIGSSPFIFRFRDTPRPNINEMLSSVKKRDIELVMLTGDHFNSAKRIADDLQIDEFHAGLTPEEKLMYVSKIAETKGLAMIGDGVNDAPALARATVGICMGKVGSSAAIDAADVVLLHDNIELLDWLIEKAKQTQTIVKQNLFLATSAIFVASLPALAGIVPLWLAVVLHEGGTVLVGLNALRLLRIK